MRTRGYSLTELIVVVVLLGVLAVIAVPRIDFAIVRQQRAKTTAYKIVTDLRRTRRMAISDAAENTDGYMLEFIGSNGSYESYRIKNRDNNKLCDEINIDSDVSVKATPKQTRFGPLGNVTSGNDTIELRCEDEYYQIEIVPATGMIKCIANP